MEIKATLNNLRMAPRKVRLAANLIKNMPVPQARAQLMFLVRKPAPFLLKLLNSAAANAKNNFSIKEDNLFVKNVLVEGGPTMKRWLPRAQGRATPLRKRTCSVKIFLGELTPTGKKAKKVKKPEVLKEGESLPESIGGQGQRMAEKKSEVNPKTISSGFNPSRQEKKHAPRQTMGNIKKIFRRKSI
jgi:large subunit ribosomal protein L22